ncbi:hypothetical protein O3G_MSEX010815 [Manduca sexta]|nr:hypothetical protein O3G_MSEX010815 [Manduca sexta]KAG6458357.1 hypothetical protein O3G_MSEX010815 [Manduca sexta]
MDPAEKFYEQAMLSLQQPMLEAAARGDSEVQRFYSGSTVLVTGGTGYLGKILIEKLIRSSKIHKIYILLRPKKGENVSERLKVLLKDAVFDQLRKKQPDFGQCITPVAGDIVEEQLGLNNRDFSTMIQKVDIIFHLAATTKFNEFLRTATLINVRGTREVLEMAKHCKRLKSFIYVSTAFCHATRSRIDSEILEQFYKSPISPEVLIRIVESMDDERLIDITEKLIDDWPNTYTFTKAVAEELVRTSAEDLPICIVRPPIVIGAHSEPSPGWIDKSCIYGPVGIVLEIMLGASHVILVAPVTVNIAPADFVTNALIVSALETKINYDNGDKDIKIYTLCSQDLFKPAQANKLLRSESGKVLQTPKCIWYSCAYEVSNKHIFWLLTWLLHYIPAYIVDAVYFLLGLKRPTGIPS